MSLLQWSFFSEAMELSTSMTVLYPQSTSAQIGLSGATRAGDPPVLYLLHGLTDDDTTWLRRTSIERYAAPLGLVVVMPQVHRSFYTDEAWGGRYWTFLSEELPALVAATLRVSAAREDTYVAGLSMGGYAAMKWALRRPGRFAAAASLSGALDLPRLARQPHLQRDLRRIFGERPIGRDDDVLALLRHADPATLPALYACCGDADEVAQDTVRFGEIAEERGIPATVLIDPGEHEWGYWDARIQDVLAWLPLPAG